MLQTASFIQFNFCNLYAVKKYIFFKVYMSMTHKKFSIPEISIFHAINN